MRTRLLHFLCCPHCSGGLRVEAFRAGDEIAEVEDGLLTCGECSRTYPVINSIPRMLPDPLIPMVVAYHGEFFERYPQATASFRARAPLDTPTAWWDAERRTFQSYSYQWRKFKEMYPDWEQVFLDSIEPVTPAFFAGRVGLDGGCGFGRSLFYAAKYGAEMIGMDLSEAIEAARENTQHLAHVHLVQGDIFHPPVRKRSLDFVYSIGVLHLLPDPKGGFLSLSRLLKPGAPMFIWVYLRGRGRQIAVFTAMRAMSTRLPLRVLNLVCLALAAAQWIGWILPYRLLRRFKATRRLAQHLPFTLYSRYRFRVLHADWFDGLSVPVTHYYKPDVIAAWYREAGHERVRIDRDWNGRALGYAPGE